MELTRQEKVEFVRNGFVKIPGVVSLQKINVALRAINHSVGKGIDPDMVPSFRAGSYCPELRGKPAITDLLFETPLVKLAESLTRKDGLKLEGGGQIALRFPVMEKPGEMHPHIDGMYSTRNRVKKGTIFTFTMLAGVFLSDAPNRFWGNFTAWPGTHRSFGDYFREHDVDCLQKGMLPKVKMPEPVQVLAKAGDVILSHYLTAHTVVVNVSPYIRYAVFFRLSDRNHSLHRHRAFSDIWLEWSGLKEVL